MTHSGPTRRSSDLATQKRPQRFREQQFLELLYKAYRPLAGAEWRKLERGPGPVIPVVDIHEVLTLLPGADYPIAEFGRDLLLLDRQPALRSEEHTSELQSLMRISYAVFCLK